jgi:hypothetical protein
MKTPPGLKEILRQGSGGPWQELNWLIVALFFVGGEVGMVVFLIHAISNGPPGLFVVPLVFMLFMVAVLVALLYYDPLQRTEQLTESVHLELQTMGVHAHRPDPEVRAELPVSSNSVIQIEDSPIRWVSVRPRKRNDGMDDYCLTEFIVPDRKVTSLRRVVEIRSVGVKTLLGLGKVVGVRWEGRNSDTGLKNRLEDDTTIRKLVMARGDHRIRAVPYSGCWVISIEREGIGPSLTPVWSRYEALARLLVHGT